MTDPRAAARPDDDLACAEVVELMTDHLEGALPEPRRARLAAHLETCDGCTEYLEQMRAIAGGLGGLREEALPAGLRDALLESFRARRGT